MKFHITNAYKVNDDATKTVTKYIYSPSNVAEKSEVPLIKYYDGNWTWKSDGVIYEYDNNGFTVNEFLSVYSSHRYIRLQHYNDAMVKLYHSPNTGMNISSTADLSFVFNYYGNYSVYFIPIPASHYVYNDVEGQYEIKSDVFYVSVARVTKDSTYSNIHEVVFQKLTTNSYLKCSPISISPIHDDRCFLRWECGGTYYGHRDENFTQYFDLGNYFSDLNGVMVPRNTDGYIVASSRGISESFGFTTIKTDLLSNNNLLYYLPEPIYFVNDVNNITNKYYMDFRLLPYSSPIDECYNHRQDDLTNNRHPLDLENLSSYNTANLTGVITFNGSNYTVKSYNILYIGLDELVSWYKNKLYNGGVDYIINPTTNYNGIGWSDTIANRVYPDLNTTHFQAILDKIKELYDSSEFDIQLRSNGFFGYMPQAGKFTTKNVNETIRVTTENVFGSSGG